VAKQFVFVIPADAPLDLVHRENKWNRGQKATICWPCQFPLL